MLLVHEIPAGTLENGGYYNASVEVTYRDGAGNEHQTEASDTAPFRCLTTPVLSVSNIPQGTTINSSSCYVEYVYTQEQGDPLNEYIVSARDGNGIIAWTSKTVYPGTSTVPRTFGVSIADLADGESYTINFEGVSVTGMRFTHDLHLSVQYNLPDNYQMMYLSNLSNKGVIRIESNIRVINGRYTGAGDVPYEEETRVDLTDGEAVIFDSNFYLGGDYQIGLLFYAPTPGSTLISLLSDGGNTVVRYIEGQLYGEENIGAYTILHSVNAGSPYTIHTPPMTIPAQGDRLFLWLQRKNNRFMMKLTNMGGER